MELTVKAMFDFMAQCFPLALRVFPVLHWRVWCPNVTDTLHHAVVAARTFRNAIADLFLRDLPWPVEFVPNDSYAVLWHRGTAGEQEDEQEAHTPILLQLMGIYKRA